MKVISFYSHNLNKRTDSHLSATNKLDYVINVFNRINEPVEILSLSTISGDSKSIKEETIQLKEGLIIVYPRAFRKRNVFEKVLHKFFDPIRIKRYLLNNTRYGETVYIYHPSLYHKILKDVIEKNNLKVILEVEEVYGDVNGNSKLKEKEFSFFNVANAYVFPNIMLNEQINKNSKPFLIAHGSYKMNDYNKQSFNDDKIHVVYSGTFDSIKGGAQLAIESAKYLDNKYHLHILGFGSSIDTANTLELIEKTKQIAKCELTYDGMISGDDYIHFLQRCDIGLSTQNPYLDFNNSSFPSKILTYMSNGLRVVSTKNKSTQKSKVSEYMYYSDYTAESVAKTIERISFKDKYDGRTVVKKLDEEFLVELSNLLKSL